MFLATALSSFFNFYLVLAIGLSLFYCWLMWTYRKGWMETKEWQIPATFTPSLFISIVIPARDEAKNIGACIDSLLEQNYPKNLFEIIIVDDHSSDETVSIIESYGQNNIQLIELKNEINTDERALNSFKKLALDLAIKKAKGSLIVSTDADCIVQPNWLSLISSFKESNNYKFVAAPVNFHQEENLLEKFQSLDFTGMMGITAAGINFRLMNMCNGANLAYEKKVFEEVDGFSGIDNLASGDDMLLMQKIAKFYPEQIGFLKNQSATNFTKAKPTLRSFLNQRIRWASKSNAYPEVKVTLLLALVFFFCWSIILSFLLLPFFGLEMFYVLLFQLLIKTFSDYRLLNSTTHFFDRRDLMKSFLPSLFLHLFYVAGVGLIANFVSSYEWKGRRVK